MENEVQTRSASVLECGGYRKGMIITMNGQPVRNRKLGSREEQQIRVRHMRRLKKRRRRILINRSILLITTIAIVLFIVLFLTPLFNIRSVVIDGNKRISTESLNEYLADISGENLFKVSESSVEKRLTAISYVKNVNIKKKYFPAAVTIVIEEKDPCAFYETENGYSVIDKSCIVLEQREDKPEDLPELTSYFESAEQIGTDAEASAELENFFEIARRIGIFENITAVELLEYNEINFEYDGRIEVICGSHIDLEQKLRLFKASINNSSFSANDHGTMDLSTPGKARFTS